MTGMGSDGAEAMARLKGQGGRTIAEAEESAVVWGMPGELVRRGGAARRSLRWSRLPTGSWAWWSAS